MGPVTKEDPRAFPYTPPSSQIVNSYSDILQSDSIISRRLSIRLFDIFVSLPLILLFSPFMLMIALATMIEGIVFPSHSGPIFDPYIACSQGKKILKLKFRTLKNRNPGLSKRLLDYRTRPTEHEISNLTITGKIIKKVYFDELPQLLSVLKGDISLLGPRPLAWHHYLRLIQLGHTVHKLMKAGICSTTHSRKGDPDFPNLVHEYEYARIYKSADVATLFRRNFFILAQCARVVLKARGL